MKRESIVECEQIVEDEVCIDFKTSMPEGDWFFFIELFLFVWAVFYLFVLFF